MSALAALKGYRTQFLYSLHYILSQSSNDLIYRLEGEEDMDILNSNGQILYAIQLKNLSRTVTLSDILSEKRTSFIRRYLNRYPDATPILVSYGEISPELKSWAGHKNHINEKEKSILRKYKITEDDWKLVKSRIQFREINEESIVQEVEKMMKDNFQMIDPIPTVGFLLNWLQTVAEKQQPITSADFYHKIEDFGKYLTERIAVHDQYGLVLKPLHRISMESTNWQLLEKEFYTATLTRYEHILGGLEVSRDVYLEQISSMLTGNNTIIIKGASGQGKTTLAYSYIHRYINDWLSFELSIQQDPVNSLKSIQAITSISKRLEIPAVFVINVQPNSTEWLQIVKEASHLNNIKFLVAIRNEDWYRASAIGVEFEHGEIDLSLSREEAGIIYSRLNERSKIIHFSDFEEAWIQLGNDAPLLEFVYSITQGDSLHNRLKHQVQQILKEGELTNNPQIEFLRIVSLADSLGARIDISKLDSNVDYQFVIEKLENEYLIRKSSDRKYIQGLHIIRSQKLAEILFDEFFNCKEEYGYKCITLLAEEDLYLFLVQLFHLRILRPDRFSANLSKISVSDWSVFSSIVKAFIWAGVQEYVEVNRKVIDECWNLYGSAWTMLIDFSFGSNYNRAELLDLLEVDDERKAQIEAINQKMTPKTDIFVWASHILDKLIFPHKPPVSEFEWQSFGQLLFWLKEIDNSKENIPAFSEVDFENAFRLLGSKALSKLMQGMYSYSDELNALRIKYASWFIERVKKDFNIIHITVGDEEVQVDYIIDPFRDEYKRSGNQFAVNVLELLRPALPDKKVYSSQGHGHRLQTFSIGYDETHKAIAISNLPLEEWVSINFCIIQLYDYQRRPKDWNEYCIEVHQWEALIKGRIDELNAAFTQLFKGSKTYAPIVPFLEKSQLKYPEKVKEPKSIIDPLGIYGGDKKGAINATDPREKKRDILHSKYENFFKSLSEFKSSIENFLSQSSQTIISKIKRTTVEGHIHNENMERLSQINLYNAITKLKEYNSQYSSTLSNIDAMHDTEISINSLVVIAVLWKDFLNDNTKGERSQNRLSTLRSDFEKRINNDFKRFSKKSSISIKYINNDLTGDKPVLLIDSDSPFRSLWGMKEAYGIVKRAIGNPDYTSLKHLMLDLGFSNIYFIQAIHMKILTNYWNSISLHTIKEKSFEDLSIFQSAPLQIDLGVMENLKIESWQRLYPEFNDIQIASEAYSKLVFLVDHFYDLRSFDKIELTEIEQTGLAKHLENLSKEIQESFQTVLDSLFVWIELFPFKEDEYIESEEEREYFNALINIKDNIFPQPKGDEEEYEIAINMGLIPEWIERLKICTENWGKFLVLLYGKYIDKYNQGIGGYIKHSSS